MEFIAVILLAALVFGGCYLVDKGFTKLFRSQAQHKSGTAVRLNKKYGSIGLLLAVLGVAAMVTGWGDGWLLLAGGVIVLLMGAALVTYYMSFGVFYDADPHHRTRSRRQPRSRYLHGSRFPARKAR